MARCATNVEVLVPSSTMMQRASGPSGGNPGESVNGALTSEAVSASAATVLVDRMVDCAALSDAWG